MAYYLRKKFRWRKSGDSKSCHHRLATHLIPITLDDIKHSKVESVQCSDIKEAPQAAKGLRVNDKCVICTNERRDARIYRWKIILGLLLPFILASLDLTVVSTALPFIASHFNRFNQFNWIVTAFTLTSPAFLPTFGQLGDLFGRHAAIQLSILLMVIGSTLCTAAQNWAMLLLGRAIQGIGGAGINNLVLIILADGVSLKENALNTTIFQLVSGVSYDIGPLIGGYLTNTNWRYCFVLGIPIAVIAHVIVWLLLRKILKKGQYMTQTSGQGGRRRNILAALKTLDFGGTFFFIFGSGLIVLATAWGEASYSCKSPAVIVSVIIGSVLLVIFFLYEYVLQEGRFLAPRMPRTIAMIPFSIFQHRNVAVIAIMSFATSAALYSVFCFINICFTLVEAYPAAAAGIQLLYYTPGLGIGVYLSIFLCNSWPRQTFLPLFLGAITETTGIALMTYAISQRDLKLLRGMMIMAGAGTGFRFVPVNLHLAGVCPDAIASMYSVVQFSLSFGGTVALTVMGAVFNNKIAADLQESGLQNTAGFNVHSRASLQAISSLPPAKQVVIRHAGQEATMWAFISILPFLGVSVLASAFMGNVWMVTRKETDQRIGEAGEDANSDVMYSSYLLALIRGRVNKEKRPSQGLAKTNVQPSELRETEAEDLDIRSV